MSMVSATRGLPARSVAATPNAVVPALIAGELDRRRKSPPDAAGATNIGSTPSRLPLAAVGAALPDEMLIDACPGVPLNVKLLYQTVLSACPPDRIAVLFELTDRLATPILFIHLPLSEY